MKKMYRDQSLYAGWARRGAEPSPFVPHTHAVVEMLLFLEGKASFWVEGREYEMHPGDLVVIPPLDAHVIRTDPDYPYERIVAHFHTEVIQQLDPQMQLLRPVVQRNGSIQNYYPAEVFPDRKHLEYLKAMCDPEGSRAVVVANLILLLQLLDRVCGTRIQTGEDAALEQKIMMYIQWHLDQPIDVETLCNRFYISRTQLSRRFREATGLSVGKYIAMKRMSVARQRIREGLSPTEVSQKMGFKEYSAFFRAYKAQFGYGPKEEKNHPYDLLPRELEMLAALTGDA